MLIEYISIDMQIAGDRDGTVCFKLQGRSRFMDDPTLAIRGFWRCGSIGICTANDDAVFRIAFLRKHEHLIAGGERAYNSPARSGPWRKDRQPSGDSAFRLQ